MCGMCVYSAGWDSKFPITAAFRRKKALAYVIGEVALKRGILNLGDGFFAMGENGGLNNDMLPKFNHMQGACALCREAGKGPLDLVTVFSS